MSSSVLIITYYSGKIVNSNRKFLEDCNQEENRKAAAIVIKKS
jgi:hypothetical protein